MLLAPMFRSCRSIAVAAVGLGALTAGAGAADGPGQQLECRGFEPFFAITAGPDGATWSEPGKDMATRQTMLRGGFQRLDFLQPPWLVWRGVDAKARRGAQPFVLNARKESCMPTMGEDPIKPLDWRAVVSHSDGRVLTGCCSVKGAAPASAAKP